MPSLTKDEDLLKPLKLAVKRMHLLSVTSMSKWTGLRKGWFRIVYIQSGWKDEAERTAQLLVPSNLAVLSGLVRGWKGSVGAGNSLAPKSLAYDESASNFSPDPALHVPITILTALNLFNAQSETWNHSDMSSRHGRVGELHRLAS